MELVVLVVVGGTGNVEWDKADRHTLPYTDYEDRFAPVVSNNPPSYPISLPNGYRTQ